VRYRRDRALAWAMPVVLVLVALTQITWAHTSDLTPWKGGGFGMFASVDLLGYRPVKMEFATDAGDVPVDIHDFRNASDRARKIYTNARGLPDRRRLTQLVELVSAAEWTVTDGVAEFERWLDDEAVGPVVHDRDERTDLRVDEVKVEVWRVTYERGAEFVLPEKITTFVMPVGHGGAR
jgi:hypothetical protein